ncbi:MAG: histidine phosphatase family protein [Gemmatimonadetes bacterium]|nr:histidine phosphatase family protein [Gemmatimonadota bacterium]MCC6769963.1 histidine phosphatase family protein [Gemmatimonadaceae bacterium]
MLTLRQFAPLALASLLIAAAPSRQADTVVLVVRHAEKAGPSGDVPLSPAGEARARSLVGVGRDAGISAVLTTQFQRTRQTGAPLAESLGITPEVMDVRGGVAEHAKGIADAVRARHAGRTVLVVGHSNTVPAIVHALGGAKYPDICDDVYDDLFTVILAADGSARVVHGKYGAPSPSTTACPAMQ